jgi:hypothetical protein
MLGAIEGWSSMNTSIIDTSPTVTELLAPYEGRVVSVSPAEIAARRRSLALGDDLNRIQGIDLHPSADRIGRLWCTGRITRAEYFDLLGVLGRAGLLNGLEGPTRD